METLDRKDIYIYGWDADRRIKWKKREMVRMGEENQGVKSLCEGSKSHQIGSLGTYVWPKV